jgi:hypothetical protein
MLVASPFTPFYISFVLAGDRGFFVGWSHRTTFLLAYFWEQLIKSRVGFDQPNMCVMFALPKCPLFFFVWRLTPWAWADYPAESAGPSVWAPDRLCVGARPSAMLGSGCRARLLNWAYPSVPPDLLVFLSGAFRAIPPCDMFDVWWSPITMLSLLPLSAILAEPRLFCLWVLLYW